MATVESLVKQHESQVQSQHSVSSTSALQQDCRQLSLSWKQSAY